MDCCEKQHQLGHQRENRLGARVDKTGSNHLMMILNATTTPLAYRTVGTADPAGGVILGPINGQKIAPVAPLEFGQPAATLETGKQSLEDRPQGLRINKVKAFPHGRVARDTMDTEKLPKVALQLRGDPVPTSICVEGKE